MKPGLLFPTRCFFLHLHCAPKETTNFSGYIFLPLKLDSHEPRDCSDSQYGEDQVACYCSDCAEVLDIRVKQEFEGTVHLLPEKQLYKQIMQLAQY